MSHAIVLATLLSFASAAAAQEQTPGNVFQATLGDSAQPTAEISTEARRRC